MGEVAEALPWRQLSAPPADVRGKGAEASPDCRSTTPGFGDVDQPHSSATRSRPLSLGGADHRRYVDGQALFGPGACQRRNRCYGGGGLALPPGQILILNSRSTGETPCGK